MKLIKDIIIEKEPLEIRSDEIDVVKENELMRTIVKSLKDTIEEKGLTSLSAPQIGYTKRIFCIKFDTEIKTFVNPVILNAEGIDLSREKCHSLPDREFLVPRNPKITIMYLRPNGQIETRDIAGVASYVFQHCVHHLDGVLASDIGLEIDDLFDKATEEEREELINDYLDSIDVKLKGLNDEIENDDMLKQTSDAIKFMEKVQKGEVKLEPLAQNNEVKRE